MSAEDLTPDGTPNPFTDDEASLQDLLLEQAGTIGELSRENDEYQLRALRFDEGVLCLEWTAARVAAHNGSIRAGVVLRCLGELASYANQGGPGQDRGYVPGWIRAARSEMGRRDA